MVVNPANENNVFLGTSNGLLVTENFMAPADQIDWSKIDDQNVRGLEFKPGETNKLYVSGSSMIYLLTIDFNGYDSEDYVILAAYDNEPPLNLEDFTGLEISSINITTVESRPERLYAYIVGNIPNYTVVDCDPNSPGEQSANFALPKAYVLVYENQTWIQLFEFNENYAGCTAPNPWRLVSPTWNPIAVNTLNPDQIFVGYTRVMGSYDSQPLVDDIAMGGGSLQFGNYSNYSDNNSHADHHDLEFEPYIESVIDTPELFDANDGGISVYQPGYSDFWIDCSIPNFNFSNINIHHGKTVGKEELMVWPYQQSGLLMIPKKRRMH